MENENKGFGLSTWAVNNRKMIFLVIAIIFLGGYGAYQSMPREQFPEIKIPEIYVGIAKPGSSPEYMAEKIVKQIEMIRTMPQIDGSMHFTANSFLKSIPIVIIYLNDLYLH